MQLKLKATAAACLMVALGSVCAQDNGASPTLDQSLREAVERLEALQGELSEMESRRAQLLQEVQSIESLIQQATGEVAATQQGPVAAPVAAAEEQEKKSQELALLPPSAADGRTAPLDDPDFPTSAPLFGSDWRFSLGGYAKIDTIHDFDGSGDKKQFDLAKIPVNGDPPPGSYTELHASETRFHVELRNESDRFEDSRFFLEWDFYDEQSPLSPRLRHAYFQYGRLMAGRYWTMLTEPRQLPFLLDFNAGDAILGGRTEQIRWTDQIEGRGITWSVGLEQWFDSLIANPFELDGVARSNFPRFTGGFTKYWDGGLWSTGFALTQLRFDAQGASDATKMAYTVTSAGRLWHDQSSGRYFGAGLTYSDGAPTDILAFANGRVPNAVLDSTGELQRVKAWSALIGLSWPWNDKWSSNFFYGYSALIDEPALLDPDLISVGWSTHANLVYEFDPRFKVALEYMYGERENVDGSDGDAQRLHFSLMYYYGR